MESLFGYTGKLLRVDLSSGEVRAESEDPASLRKYLGGMSLGARILYDEVPPGVSWSDPANRIILASGPLGGTRVMGSGNFCVVTKGAMTDGPTATQASGFFGAYLRLSGFDAVVIHGRAEKLSYLYIRDGKAELRDASHLAGKDTWETEDLIKKELGYRPQAVSVFGIGPAGEKLVRFAALVGDRGHVAAHNGVGAVMGAKNLKAIAVARGNGRLKLSDAALLKDLSGEMFETIKKSPGWSSNYHWGTLWLMGPLATGTSPTGHTAPFRNYGTTVSPMTPEQLKSFSPEFLRSKLSVKPHPCWACQMHHCHLITIPEGPYAGAEGEEPEYEGYAGVGTQVGIYDGLAATALSNEVDRLGMDVNETGWVLGMAMECYEKGILTREDTGGIEMTWGNVEAVRAMMNRIARREGIGDVLAEGTARAARRIGGKALDMGIYTAAGTTPVGHDHRRHWAYILDNCVSDTGTTELHLMPRAASLGLTEPEGPFMHREAATLMAKVRGVTPLIDSLGVCRQANREVPALLTGMVNAATGWQLTWDDLVAAGLRGVNLLRAFNVRHGYRTAVEVPSQRYAGAPADGPACGKSVLPVLDEMLDVYYREMGWDRASGRPLPETLRRLGLDDVVAQLWP